MLAILLHKFLSVYSSFPDVVVAANNICCSALLIATVPVPGEKTLVGRSQLVGVLLMDR